MSDYSEFEVVLDGEEVCAITSGPSEDAYNEAKMYARQYINDGRIVEIFEVKRTLIWFFEKDK